MKSGLFCAITFQVKNSRLYQKKNARNRSKLLYHHKAGSRSFMSHAAKSVEALGAIELFASEYCSIEKGWDLGAKHKYDEMKLLQANTTLEDGTRTMTDEEICRQVLGKKIRIHQRIWFWTSTTTN